MGVSTPAPNESTENIDPLNVPEGGQDNVLEEVGEQNDNSVVRQIDITNSKVEPATENNIIVGADSTEKSNKKADSTDDSLSNSTASEADKNIKVPGENPKAVDTNTTVESPQADIKTPNEIPSADIKTHGESPQAVESTDTMDKTSNNKEPFARHNPSEDSLKLINKVLKLGENVDANKLTHISIALKHLSQFEDINELIKSALNGKENLNEFEASKLMITESLKKSKIVEELKNSVATTILFKGITLFQRTVNKEKLKRKGPEHSTAVLQEKLTHLFAGFSYIKGNKIFKPFDQFEVSSFLNSAAFARNINEIQDPIGKNILLKLFSKHFPGQNMPSSLTDDNKTAADNHILDFNRTRELSKGVKKNKIIESFKGKIDYLNLQRQIGEVSVLAFMKKQKELLNEAQKLRNYGIEGISLSQNSFMSALRNSPQFAFLGDKKDRLKFGIKKEMRILARETVLTAKYLAKAPFSLALFPAKVLLKKLSGSQSAANKNREQLGLKPITARSEARDGFKKFFSDVWNADLEARNQIESKMEPFKGRFTKEKYEKLKEFGEAKTIIPPITIN